ncbi:MAG: hypothetical protein ABI639_05195 [Thermoanaerobaculia bacterium]
MTRFVPSRAFPVRTASTAFGAWTVWLLATAAGVSLAAPATAGIVMRQEVRGEGDAAKYQNMSMRASIDTGGAKMEILSSGNPMMSEGNYMLVRPDDDALLLVNPKDKTYATLDFGAMMGSMSQMMGANGQNGVSMEVKGDPVVEKLLDEDGGQILGRATRHYRWRTRYTVAMNLPMGMSMEIATDQTQDLWTADIAIDPKIMHAFENLAGGGAIPEGLRKLVTAAKVTQKGFPLKVVTVTSSKTTSTGSGPLARMAGGAMARANDQPHTVTMEVKELSEEKVPNSVFAIPAGYTETELLAPGMRMPDMNPQH